MYSRRSRECPTFSREQSCHTTPKVGRPAIPTRASKRIHPLQQVPEPVRHAPENLADKKLLKSKKKKKKKKKIFFSSNMANRGKSVTNKSRKAPVKSSWLLVVLLRVILHRRKPHPFPHSMRKRVWLARLHRGTGAPSYHLRSSTKLNRDYRVNPEEWSFSQSQKITFNKSLLDQ